MLKSVESVFRTNRIFLFLVIFRWASLIPALLTLAQNNNPSVLSPLVVLIIAISVNAVISIFNHNLNQLVVDHPYTMSIDLLFSAFILTVSGGSSARRTSCLAHLYATLFIQQLFLSHTGIR
jgi:hypothetical protein